jgi:RNA polymerase sigma-70 factor (ECF subfamily)
MPQPPETRPSLIRRLRDSGDAEAWQEFVAIYQPLVYRLARGKGLQDADAQELVQDVMIAVSGAVENWVPDAET